MCMYFVGLVNIGGGIVLLRTTNDNIILSLLGWIFLLIGLFLLFETLGRYNN